MNTFVSTPTGITAFISGVQYQVAVDHCNFTAIKTALAEGRYSDVPSLVDVVTTVKNWMSIDNDFQLVNGALVYQGIAFTDAVTDKVLNMIEAGNSASALYKFLRKVRSNPSKTAQSELLLFCVANQFMIDEDGDIIAYKGVRNDYMDIHSGTVRNKVGDRPKMDRGQVDDDRTRTCSTGLHFASENYARTWHRSPDARLMIMKVNPKDVVSIPADYNNQKGRCCEYSVIAEIPMNSILPKKEVYTPDDLDPIKIIFITL